MGSTAAGPDARRGEAGPGSRPVWAAPPPKQRDTRGFPRPPPTCPPATAVDGRGWPDPCSGRHLPPSLCPGLAAPGSTSSQSWGRARVGRCGRADCTHPGVGLFTCPVPASRVLPLPWRAHPHLHLRATCPPFTRPRCDNTASYLMRARHGPRSCSGFVDVGNLTLATTLCSTDDFCSWIYKQPPRLRRLNATPEIN